MTNEYKIAPEPLTDDERSLITEALACWLSELAGPASENNSDPDFKLAHQLIERMSNPLHTTRVMDGFRYVCLGNERGRRTVIANEGDRPSDMHAGDISAAGDMIVQEVEDTIWRKCYVKIEATND